jgi:hypothetical protein
MHCLGRNIRQTNLITERKILFARVVTRGCPQHKGPLELIPRTALDKTQRPSPSSKRDTLKLAVRLVGPSGPLLLSSTP